VCEPDAVPPKNCLSLATQLAYRDSLPYLSVAGLLYLTGVSCTDRFRQHGWSSRVNHSWRVGVQVLLGGWAGVHGSQ
jgi:hypothetical protein